MGNDTSWRTADISLACEHLSERTSFSGEAISREWNAMKAIILSDEAQRAETARGSAAYPAGKDRELIELAAKAAGYGGEWSHTHQRFENGRYVGAFNPIVDDGARYRLMRTLKISVDFADASAWHRLRTGELIQEFWGGDCVDEAHAIVAVAAEIGRQTR